MKSSKTFSFLLVLGMSVAVFGCAGGSTKNANIANEIRTSLDQAGLKQVTASHDISKGVVTLGGQSSSETEKLQAASIAKAIAVNQVVANEIAVIPPGGESDARTVNSDLDRGIESNLNAALIQSKLHDSVKYAVNSRVVTLTGDVDSPAKRAQAATIAAAVPNVQQVVNALQVKGQKATSSN